MQKLVKRLKNRKKSKLPPLFDFRKAKTNTELYIEITSQLQLWKGDMCRDAIRTKLNVALDI